MDWLYTRKNVIDKKLAVRHLKEGSLVLSHLYHLAAESEGRQ